MIAFVRDCSKIYCKKTDLETILGVFVCLGKPIEHLNFLQNFLPKVQFGGPGYAYRGAA